MVTLKYNLITANLDCGINEHPQKVLESLGYKIHKWEAQTLFDCVIVEVDDIIEPLPPYLEVMPDYKINNI